MHILTAMVFTAAVFAALSGAMFMVWRSAPEVPGPFYWGFGLLSVPLAIFLGLAEGTLPLFVTAWVANLALTAGLVLVLAGIARFVGRPVPVRVLSVPLAVYVAVQAYFVWAEPSLDGRVLANGVVHPCLLLGGAAYLLRYPIDGCRMGQVTAGAFLAVAGAGLLMVVPLYLLGGQWGADLFEHPLVRSRLAVNSVSSFAWGLALVVMTMQRVVAAERVASAELAVMHTEVEKASRAKSEFLANMSHELRTPLNAIIGFASTMESEIFGPMGSPKYREYVGDIMVSGEHLLALINDVLDVSAIEAGKLDLQKEAVDAASVVDGACRLVAGRARNGNVALNCDVAEDLPRFMADRRRVKQVVLNLLSNAIKFTPQGGRVTLSVARNGNGALAFSVADSGIGMDEGEVKTALAKFGQVDSALARKNAGTGLGLPLSVALVELHGGSLIIDSTKGEGTTVTAMFPLS